MTSGPIIIMAGGTGGHIFPGLAVADELRKAKCPVVWLGTQRGLEARIVPARGIDIEWITIRGLRGRGLRAWVTTPLQMLAAIFQVSRVFRRLRPSAVLGLGGFVSAPGGVAAWLTRKPLIIHEQNAVAGTANRLLAPLARQVFSAFPDAFSRRTRCTVIGNPVRADIAAVPKPEIRFAQRADPRLRVLVIGGSQGARILNQTVPAALAGLPQASRPQVRHQAGKDLETARYAYTEAGVEATVEPFIDDMAEAYAWADLVIARAGALTVAELEAVGVAAILVPYPYAIDNHQTRNAEHFTAHGAGVVIADSELSPERLAAAIETLSNDRNALLKMAQTARAQAQVDAAKTLAQACLAARIGGAA